MGEIKIDIWNSEDLKNNFLEAAGLRIRIFRDFPYLYQGSLDYEKEYLSIYLQSSQSVFVAARDLSLPLGRQLIGLSSGIPLKDENLYVQDPFLKSKQNMNDFFYFGESVLLAGYRGKGIGHAFFDGREKFALDRGYTKTCFCAVDRPDNHPLRPADYLPLNVFWEKRGYRKKPELRTFFSWQDLEEDQESAKVMTFWMKEW